MGFKIVFFNHKGGVSKTTTTYNLGWMLAKMGHKTLLVDADPQCNLSALILGDDFDRYYFDEATKANNLKDGVKAAFEAKIEPISAIDCPKAKKNNNLYLLPGHADLSEYEASLSFAQNSNNAIVALQNLPGAFNALITRTADKIGAKFILIDLNPGLSAINQNLFISSNGFIVPTNPDPFSLMAINTLAAVLPKWTDWASRMQPLFASSSYPLPGGKPRFIGEVVQRFNIRKGKAAKPYRDNIADIKARIVQHFVPILGGSAMLFSKEKYQEAKIADDYCLAEIPDFQGLLPKSIDANVPVYELSDAEISETGVVLDGMKASRDKFREIFQVLADQILIISQ